ncbi:DUF4326 domain-containing protein [Nevskia sp.]|uniref:DUF4326 domain-containing protein n=1 Tax=Nevskia sp. TaxID=1929292 RepID=UPI0025CCA7BB|nr:DUF4326 domain-containing protein [Nevskia sp.]
MSEQLPEGATVAVEPAVSHALPVRVQLRRTKGWRMPPNTVKVHRTTKWGNPFGDRESDRSWRSAAVEAFRLENHCKPTSDFAELRGKNLACWCPLDGPCHADVLLKLANAS